MCLSYGFKLAAKVQKKFEIQTVGTKKGNLLGIALEGRPIRATRIFISSRLGIKKS